MGVVTSSLSYHWTRTDDPDPVTGLTSRDKYMLQSSWAPIRKNLTGNGVALLLLFFDRFPEEKQHFPFKDEPKEQLKSSKKFQAHCNSVMTALDSLVSNLNDSELLVSILEKLAQNHKRRHITNTSFSHLAEVVLELFSSIMSQEAVKVWDKTLKVVFGVVERNL